MSESNDKNYITLLPYEVSSFDRFIIYDNAPFVDYHRRRCFLTQETIKKDSANVIKYYTTTTIEPVKVGGDDMIEAVELKNNSGPKYVRIAGR